MSTEEWAIFDSGFTGCKGIDHGSVLFTSAAWPCAQVCLTLLPDGSVIDFGVLVESYSTVDTRITTRFLRSIQFGDLSRRALIELRRQRDRPTAWDPPSVAAPTADDLNDWKNGFRRTGRAGRPDRDFAIVAHLYVEALPGGSPVIPEVARRLGIDATAARNQVHEARRRSLLTPPPRGRAGGELTRKARNLLAGMGMVPASNA